MNGSAFYVFSVKTEEGKHYAYADTIQRCNDLLSIFGRIQGLETANACKTRHEADEIARYWNETYKANGTFAF